MSAGVSRRELHGEKVMYLGEAPVELRPALRHWFDVVAPEEARYNDSGRAALTWWDGWEAFIFWVKDALREALYPLGTVYNAEHEN